MLKNPLFCIQTDAKREAIAKARPKAAKVQEKSGSKMCNLVNTIDSNSVTGTLNESL